VNEAEILNENYEKRFDERDRPIEFDIEREKADLLGGSSDLFGFIGRWFLSKFHYPFLLSGLFLRILMTSIVHLGQGRRMIRKHVVQQIYFTGLEALVLIAVVGLLLGTLVIVQSAAQLERVGGDEVLGSLLVIVVIRELGPLVTAIVVILRSGTAVSIELGYMNVLKEIHTLRMQGINPLHLIAIPRLIGMVVSLICLFLIFDIVAILGGAIDAWVLMGIPLSNFLDNVAKAITGADIVVGLVKVVFFGFIISLISVYRGLSVRESITEVPPAASKSAVECFLICLIFNVMVSGIFYI
jgi:phospholipid/cholesterol/gamma-HCH transport system permease protein